MKFFETKEDLRARANFAEQALTAALNALQYTDEVVSNGIGGDALRWIDFKRTTITKAQLSEWWAKHR